MQLDDPALMRSFAVLMWLPQYVVLLLVILAAVVLLLLLLVLKLSARMLSSMRHQSFVR